jgi:hypothetical protein
MLIKYAEFRKKHTKQRLTNGSFVLGMICNFRKNASNASPHIQLSLLTFHLRKYQRPMLRLSLSDLSISLQNIQKKKLEMK